MQTSKPHSSGRFRAPIRSARNSSASAAGSFIHSMPQRWNASARQSRRALRVRRQGIDRHHQRPRFRPTVRAHAKAQPGNPCDAHTLAAVIEATERLTGCAIERGYVDKGYRGNDRTRAASSSQDRSAATDTPRSTPTASPGCATGSCCLTRTDANH